MKKKGRALKPTQLVSIGFFGLIALGGILLMMPFASADGEMTPFLPAFFTSTSAVSLTGLNVLDTEFHWSTAGKFIIAALIQLSGFGIMSLTSLAGMILTGRLGIASRMNAAAEGRTQTMGGVRSTLAATLGITVLCEGVVAVLLASRLHNRYGVDFLDAVGQGWFYAISSFNNAGFGLKSQNLVPYVADFWIIIPIAFSIIIGGLGFPVVRELWARARRRVRRRIRPHLLMHLSVTSMITVIGTVLLLGVGWVAIACLEWNKALAGLSVPAKVLASFFQAVTPRTAGFNSVDYGQFHPSSLFLTDILMFIGGGSAGTAGGVKITTIMVLLAAMMAEFRGEEFTVIGRRRIHQSVVRQAMTVFALGILLVTVGTMSMMLIEDNIAGSKLLFEVTSAFGTVGLTTGITPILAAPSQVILMVLMYLGRIGPITLVTALASRRQQRRFKYPEERPFIG